MNETELSALITTTFMDAEVVSADGNSFFFVGEDRKLPFATLVTTDAYDQFSDLSRPSVFRLNVGVSRETFDQLLGEDAMDGNHDFTALDRIMPHPVYGQMHWICVLNPSEATFEKVQELLAEAHALAAKRSGKSKPTGPN